MSAKWTPAATTEAIAEEDIQFTAFTEGKMRAWFKMIDVGRDGHVDKGDFLTIADRFVKVLNRLWFLLLPGTAGWVANS